MVYGHYVEDAIGNKRFFIEGCSYCQMSTGGQHKATCPMKDARVSDMGEGKWINQRSWHGLNREK